MKKGLLLLFALIISVVFAGTGFTQDKPKDATSEQQATVTQTPSAPDRAVEKQAKTKKAKKTKKTKKAKKTKKSKVKKAKKASPKTEMATPEEPTKP